MTQSPLPLTPSGLPPLQHAYAMSGLQAQGYTLDKALAVPLIRQSLEAHARAITEPRKA